MGSCFGCFRKDPKSDSALNKAKKMKKTKFNKTINRNALKKLITKKDQQKLSQQFFELKMLLTDKYSVFTEIIEKLFLTGIGGINADNISSKGIKCIVSVSFESSDYDLKGVQYIRIPVSFYANRLIDF